MAQWCKDHGLSSSYEEFLLLPLGVIQDIEMYMEVEQGAAKRDRARGRSL